VNSPARFGGGSLEPAEYRLVTDTFRAFAGRLAAGEEAAAAELLARYSTRLVGLARSRLMAKLAPKVDPEDMVQSALRTFFRRLGAGTIELRDWSSLAGLLALLTIRRCAKEGRAHTNAGRDVAREIPLGALEDAGREVPDREPTPHEAAAFADLFETLLASLQERDRRVVEALATGATIAEVAADTNRTETTVYRTLRRVKESLLKGRLARELS